MRAECVGRILPDGTGDALAFSFRIYHVPVREHEVVSLAPFNLAKQVAQN